MIRNAFQMTALRWMTIVSVIVSLPAHAQVDDSTDGEKAFYYLLGFSAPHGEDPVAYGRCLLKNPDNCLAPQQSGGLKTPPQASRCNTGHLGCLKRMAEDPFGFDITFTDYTDELLNRYQTLLDMPAHATPKAYRWDSPIPAYSDIYDAQWLEMLSASHAAKDGNFSEAQTRLLHMLDDLRGLFSQRDLLLDKTMIAPMVARTLDLMLVLQHAYPEDIRWPDIPRLTPAERSLVDTTIAELRFGFGLVDTFQTDFAGAPLLLPKRIVSYLQVMPMHWAEHLHGTIDMIKLTQASAYQFREHINASPHSAIRDLKISGYASYAGRIWDLDAKIQLFNAFQDAGNHLIAANQMINPYTNKANGAHLAENSKRICLDGPLPDPQQIRCLPSVFTAQKTDVVSTAF